MIILGLILIIFPIIFIIINQQKIFTKKTMILQNMFLIILSFLYLFFCFYIKTQPYIFKITAPIDYVLYSAVIFIFSPFLWLVLYYFIRIIYRNFRIIKNAKLKSNEEYTYYRDDLNKISPSIIMFTSLMENNIKKSVGATILKLKLTKHIIEEKGKLKYNSKMIIDNSLLESEQIVINFIENNGFDEKKYRKCVEKEAIEQNYVKKNNKRVIIKLLKICIMPFIPVILISNSLKFDDYVFKSYSTQTLDGIQYLKINDHDDIEKLYNNGTIDEKDYYHHVSEINGQKRTHYSYSLIRADRYKYDVVKEKVLFEILDVSFILLSIVSIFVSIFLVIEQIRYFNKNYIRTIKGNELLSKAYALKNYLKDFSIINERSCKDLVLWEYYLIYAVILDINTTIEDEIIGKYLKNL